jgi:hypothetical protein
MVDLDQEISRCEKNLVVARAAAEKLKATISKPDYEVNVPADVRAANTEKVCISDYFKVGILNDLSARETPGRGCFARKEQRYVQQSQVVNFHITGARYIDTVIPYTETRTLIEYTKYYTSQLGSSTGSSLIA